MDKEFLNRHLPCTCSKEWKEYFPITPEPSCKRCRYEQKKHNRNIQKLI